jgi:P27 family predicted phage terminase small subunit
MAARKPYLLKQAEGNRGKRKNKPAIQPPPGEMVPTVELDPVAQAEWNRVLSVAYWLRPSDAGILTLRCVSWSRWVAAEADVAKRGNTIRTRNGNVKNPSIQISRDYRLTIIQCDTKLGLNAIDRERITAEQKPQIDPLDEVMFG